MEHAGAADWRSSCARRARSSAARACWSRMATAPPTRQPESSAISACCMRRRSRPSSVRRWCRPTSSLPGKHVLQVREPFRRFVNLEDRVPPSIEWLTRRRPARERRRAIVLERVAAAFRLSSMCCSRSPASANPDAKHLALVVGGTGLPALSRDQGLTSRARPTEPRDGRAQLRHAGAAARRRRQHLRKRRRVLRQRGVDRGDPFREIGRASPDRPWSARPDSSPPPCRASRARRRRPASGRGGRRSAGRRARGWRGRRGRRGSARSRPSPWPCEAAA